MKILPDTTQSSLAQRKIFCKLLLTCNTLSFFFFFSGAPFLVQGGDVSIFLRCGMQSNTWKPKWSGPVVPQGRGTAVPGGYGTSVWDFMPGSAFDLEVREPSQLVDQHQTSPIQVKPFLFISKMWPLSSATISGHSSIASLCPSSPSLGWALGSSKVWGLPFDLGFSLEKSKLFAAQLEPARSYSPVNIFSFVLPRNVIWVIVLPFLLSPAQGNPNPHINHNTGSSQLVGSIFTHPLDAHLAFSILFPTTSRAHKITWSLVAMSHWSPCG